MKRIDRDLIGVFNKFPKSLLSLSSVSSLLIMFFVSQMRNFYLNYLFSHPICLPEFNSMKSSTLQKLSSFITIIYNPFHIFFGSELVASFDFDSRKHLRSDIYFPAIQFS
jgi:hypothetical protein